MSKKVIKEKGQSVSDIAIQEYGHVDGMWKILRDNPELNLESSIPDNFAVIISEPPIDKDVVNYLVEKNVKPAFEHLPTPLINLTATALVSFPGTQIGQFSTSQNYQVSGSDLLAPIVITAPAGFIINTNNSNTNQSPITLTPTGGAVASTTIYVKFNPAAAIAYSDSITHTSSGAASQNVSVSGAGLAPDVVVSVTSLTTFANRFPGTISAAQTYTVSGSGLTNNIVVTAPAGYIINTDGSNTQQSPISLVPVGGVVAATTIHVKFNPVLAQTYNGNITHASTGATTENVSVSGTGAYMTATGGTITTDGNYRIHSFLASANFVPTSIPEGTPAVEYLVIAGGGGGASNGGGGGGAGGYLTGTVSVLVQTYPVVVGAGGGTASNGSNSSFNGIVATGGGKGGSSASGLPSTGGSGGGGSGVLIVAQAGAAGTAGQGNAGGGGYSVLNPQTAGGGGGAGGAGANGVQGVGGAGGAGLSSSITGAAVSRAGGGGGSVRFAGTGGAGSAGGGSAASASNGTAGTANTGGGGGGGAYNDPTGYTGGAGGSGIIIIRYQFQ